MLQVEEYLLKERFDTKYLHRVSYLRDAYGVGVLQDVVGVIFYKKLKNVSCEYDRLNG